MVVAVLSRDNALHVKAHLFEFTGKSLETVDFVNDLLGELTLGGIFDVSEQVLDSNLFGFGSSDGAWDVDKLPVDVTFGIGFLLGEVCLSW